MAETPSAIEFRSVSKNYGSSVVVENLNLTIPQGKITVFVGPSGCGKTTSLRMINRMVEPSQGQILVQGKPNTELEAHQLRRQLGYVLQQVGLLPHKTIVDNIATPDRLKGVPKKQAREKALSLMDTVGLARDLAQRYPAQISGGQAQRVGVARALATEAEIILMDEPFSAIDPVIRAELQKEILRLQKELGKTIVFVTHDIDEAVLLGDYIAVFAMGGKIAQFGTPEQILREPADDFVSSLVGRDRGTRRLTFADASDLQLYPANQKIGHWQLNIVDGKPSGWLFKQRLIPGGSLFIKESNLRDALDSVLSSPSGWGVAVDKEGKVLGLLKSEDVLAATEAERYRRYGVQ